MSVLHDSSRRQQDAIMNIPCFVGICVLVYGPLVSGACNVTLYAQRKTLNFTSPNYPSYYRNNDDCYWDIYPETRGYRVVLEMVYSDIQSSPICAYDVLTIYVIDNGNGSKASSHRICGESRWTILIEEDQHFHVVFKTDGNGTRSGFLIRYFEKIGEETCGVPLVATSAGKTFFSPGYPNTYFNRQICTWTITTEHPDQTIQLKTVDSVLQNVSSRGTCISDYVTVYYGSYQLGKFCGNERPVFNSGGGALKVRLQTDSSQVYKGFKMLYKAIPATTCNVELPVVYSPMMIVSPGFPNYYMNGLDCQWTLNAPIEANITVEVLFLELEKSSSCVGDYLLFKDGTTKDARQLAKICELRSTPITSSRNHMTIIFHSDHAVTGQGFRLQYSSAPICGLTDLYASLFTWKYLTSPGNPVYYNNVNCEWKIRAIFGLEIKVEILYLSLESSTLCSRDYLLFKDGSSYWAPELVKYCGDYNNKQIVSSHNYMTIIFHTDGSTTRRGFYLKYKAGKFATTTATTEKPHDSNCGTSFRSASKYSWRYLSSPGYPNYNYNNNIYCKWIISAPAGYKVKVEVQILSVEHDPSCSKDYVLFSDGSSSDQTRLGKYCSSVPGDIVSSRNTMTITFQTDSSVTGIGFSLKYIAWATGCGGDYTISYTTKYIESPNYPLSYPANTYCEWTISTPVDGYIINVEVVFFNIDYSRTCSSDYVEIYDVDQSIGRWCGTNGPNTQTTGPKMTVIFLSDGSTSRSGFKLSFTAGERKTFSAEPMNMGAILGGGFGGVIFMCFAICCCRCLCQRKKSNDQQQRNRPHEGHVSFINVPSYPQPQPIPPIASTATTVPPALPLMFPPPPSYSDVVKDDPPPYCQAVPLSDIQPAITSSPSGAFEYQGIDNPASPS